MPHETPLVTTLAAALGLALAFGLLAHRLRISPLVGYLLAGVAVGPFTPGFVADQAIATQLAELGVILLMFGVGLHFSARDLLDVRLVALPGALVQMAAATAMGMGLATVLGWPLHAGFVFGLALSVASTVVLLRALQERRILRADRGRIAVGWLVVEDLAMVLALVLLPVLAQAVEAPAADLGGLALSLGIALAKVAAFLAVMLVVGRRLIPNLLHYVAHTGSRELFRLAVLAITLGVAFGAASLFGVSFALGAFFAGMTLSGSELSQRAAEETLPLRDAFAVLFFVAAGMLFDPGVLVTQPWPLLATLGIIVVGKSLAAYAIVRLFGRSSATARVVAASLAQIGEFSFILAGLGVALELLPQSGRDLIIAGAILSILVNPLVFAALARVGEPAPEPRAVPSEPPQPDLVPTSLRGHAVIVGFGRVGQALAEGLKTAGRTALVVEDRPERAALARASGIETLEGNAADPDVAAACGLPEAACIFVAIPNGFEAGQVVEQAHRLRPGLAIVARAHSDEEVAHLAACGAGSVVMGERELAREMLARAPEAAPAAG